MTTEKVKEILDDVFGVYYSEYMGQGEYGEEEAQEALDTALNALDEVEKYKKALEKVKRDIDSELLQWKFIDDKEAKNAFAATLRILSECIEGTKNGYYFTEDTSEEDFARLVQRTRRTKTV